MLHNKPLLIRFLIFIGLFVIVTGILGSWIVRTRLLYGFHFFIYGNMGKMIIFGSIAFFLMAKDKLAHFKVPKWSRTNLIHFILTILMMTLFFPLARRLLKESDFFSYPTLSINTHAVAVSIPVFLALGVFGLKFIKKFTQTFTRQLTICAGISVGFYFAIFQVWKLWPYLSSIVLRVTHWMFSLTFDHVLVFPPLTLVVEDFAVRIEQACSGVDSIFLFSALYILIGILDWKLFDHKKIILTFIPALIGLFLINILRVYILILIGVLISPELTIKLFHTYLGMILFVIYFAVFWKVLYSWMKKGRRKKHRV